MNNKKGFTLVELLGVIVILGVIMVVAGGRLLNVKKETDKQAGINLEKSLRDIAAEVYMYEMTTNKGGVFANTYKNLTANGTTTSDGSGFKTCDGRQSRIVIFADELKGKSYLKSALKVGNESCEGFVEICKSNNGPVFSAKICCGGYDAPYATVNESCGGFSKDYISSHYPNTKIISSSQLQN